MDDDVLVVRGVRKTFEADAAPVRALRGADLTLARHDFVAVMGPSGCGKSTLLNLVAGLDTADEGSIVLDGVEITGLSEDDLARMRRRHVGIVFQFFNLLEGMSVLENVALPAMVAGLKRKPAESRARDLLDLLGLADKAKATPSVLSGGQRQRLAIARALANRPLMVLADEPTGALDSEGGQEVLELFRRLHDGGQTILMVTHDDDVAAAAQRIVRIKDGRVVSAGDGAPTPVATGVGEHEACAAVEPVRYRAWRQLRRRRWGALALVALIGLLGGVTLAALIGARRNATAYHRLLVHAQPWDVLVNPDLGSQSALQPAKVAALPQVRAASGLAGYAALPQGGSLDSADLENTETLAFTSATGMGELFRPKVVAGRVPDPSRADEVAIDPRYAARHDLHPGSTISLTLLNVASANGPNPQTQNLAPLTVAGIVLMPEEVSQAQGTDSARILLTPAFDALHHSWMEYFGVLAWLKDPAHDMPAFRSGVQALVPNETVDFQTQGSTTALAQQAIRPETVALVAFGLLAGAAALVIAAQMLARRVSEDDDDLALAAAGLTRLQRWAARMLEVTVLAAGGATVALAIAIAASGVFPVGPAATAEPSPGFHINVAWTVVGWLAIIVLLVLAVAFPAWRASRLGVGESSAVARRSRVVETLARSGAAPTAVVGVRMALETGRGRRSVPLRLSLLGSVVGVGLLVGAVVFGASLRNLLDRPGSYGWRWDATTAIDIGDPSQMPAAEHYIQTVTGRPGVQQAAVLENSTVSMDNHSVAALGWRPLHGELAPTLLSGRLPTGPAEIAVGAKSLAAGGHSIGDTVTVSGPAGSQRLEIVGEVIFPSLAKYSGADNADLGTGVLLNQRTLDGIAPAPDEQHVVVTLARGANPNDVLVKGFDDLTQQGGLALSAQPQRPGAVVDLDQVRTVPLWLAVLFGVGGVLAITNLVGTAIARRRHDLALLKSLGFVRRQLHRAVAWHATTISLITVAVAIPLGIIAGRLAWRFLAHSLGVAPTVTIPVLLFVLIVPATVFVANLAAAIPARMAARTSTALALRSE